MSNRSVDQDQATPPPGVLAGGALRVIDSCMRALQRLRNRFAPPIENARASRDDGRHGHGATDEAPTEVAAAPPRRSLLRRILIVLLVLLFGVAGGALLAYRGFAQLIELRGAAVERLQEEIDHSRKEETRNANLVTRFQKENGEYRLQLREAKREVEEYQDRVEELKKQLDELKRAERLAQQGGATTGAALTYRSRRPQKTGNCAVGTASGLTECIEKFNRP